MSNKTRKYAWPVSAVMAFALVAALAAFVVLAASPGATSSGNTTSCANGADTTISSKPTPAISAAVPSGSPC